MKIVFSSLSGYGHIYPLLPLAIAAQEAGHDLLYATGERFHPLMQRLGFRTVPVGIPIREAFGPALLGLGVRTVPAGVPIREAFGTVVAGKDKEIGELSSREWHEPPIRALNDVLPRRFAADMLPVLQAEQPDLVVYEAGNPGAAFAAHRLGIPAVCHSHARAEAIDPEDQWQRLGVELLHAVAAEHGVELPEGQYLLADRYLDIYPRSLQETSFVDRPERMPLRPVQFSDSGELPAIVLAERKRPLVYLTLGTVVGTIPALRAAIDGLSALDVDVLVAAGPNMSADEVGDMPGNVHFERWVPQSKLLPLVDLAVHHGGSGTTLSATGAGVPQLFLPVGFDGYLNAGAVSAAGAGRRLLPEGVERGEELRRADVVAAAPITEAAGALLTDLEARQAAKALAEEIAAMPSPAEMAARLPEFC